ncbi:asparagine synthase (glutamine-hydrolyzing) [candidate division KSB1 bacterium]|nr:asparagine synthase (glutamine-hydrolyzing) [candidate division KSB1 bacterium]RQV99898.1 MAG: asparagine synthase (glutamine-hydrolyzing) [candidate division KSB1 bacterium]
MCGICGIIHPQKDHPVECADVKRMCDVMKHRGPDDEGQYIFENVGLGMRRLSIIDLSTGHQPIYNEDRSMAIVFNGEIYNHQSIRQELQSKGHHFTTKTDTEAIIHAYEEWGVDCVHKLNGMFGFAIWDSRKHRLFMARDRIGIKPLYYYRDEQQLVFASELKSIVQLPSVPKEIEPKALDTFLTFEYIPSPFSIFKNVHKVPAGHWLLYQDGEIKIHQYWCLQYRRSTADVLALEQQLQDILEDAVKIRLMSDVPLGAFLSGGLDSSSVVAMMSRHSSEPVKSFSIGFDESTYNELPYARAIAEKYHTDHFEEIIRPDATSLTEKILWMLDEPFGDFSVFPTFLVSEMARKNVTVVLSGDGGDELLAGYDTYIAQRLAAKYETLPAFLRKATIEPIINALPPTEKKKGFINRAKRFIEGARLPAHLQHVRWMIFLQRAEKELLYSYDFRNSLNGYDAFGFIEEHFAQATSDDPLDQQEYVDIKTYLVDDILVKVDRMSMAHSLEARVPFLDHRFVEFAATIPSNFRLHGKRTKYILKSALRDELPLTILERGKEGFSIPIKNWIKSELKPMMMSALSEQNIKEKGFFDPSCVRRLVDEHLKGQENHSHRLWALIVFHMWYDLYMNNKTQK